MVRVGRGGVLLFPIALGQVLDQPVDLLAFVGIFLQVDHPLGFFSQQGGKCIAGADPGRFPVGVQCLIPMAFALVGHAFVGRGFNKVGIHRHGLVVQFTGFFMLAHAGVKTAVFVQCDRLLVG